MNIYKIFYYTKSGSVDDGEMYISAVSPETAEIKFKNKIKKKYVNDHIIYEIYNEPLITGEIK